MTWDWLSFFVGTLLGWLTQWLTDVAYWRRQAMNSVDEELLAEMERLQKENADLHAYQKQLEESSRLLTDYRTTLAACSTEIDQLSASHARAMLEIESLKKQLAATRTTAPEPSSKSNGQGLAVREVAVNRPASLARQAESRDDLVLIDGISPKVAELLQGYGIRSYAQLAAANVDQLRMILSGAGTRFRFADPSTWPYQARLAAAGDWDALMTWQRNLHAGVAQPA
ncbi:MAG: hypothetical protein J5I90_01015 [Caldilineales bacterium]|nr:hypothetical protein [Caldilineales bacterium]